MGRLKMEFSSVDIAGLASEIFTQLQAATPSRRLRLEIGSLPHARCDRKMIREVLQNLLVNAIKFSPMDEEAVIELDGAEGEDGNVYSVTDHGIGFDMRYTDKLFRVFERVHATGLYEGSGIGLALVKRIITRHGGRVWAEGKVNEGATIYFSIPVSSITQMEVA
jgi:two-component system sensor kinase